MNVVFACTIAKVETLSDNSIQLKLQTQELPPKEMSTLFELKGGVAHALISPRTILEKDIKNLPQDFPSIGKKKSQELRWVLYRKWEKLDTDIEFENFYQVEMNKLIEGVRHGS